MIDQCTNLCKNREILFFELIGTYEGTYMSGTTKYTNAKFRGLCALWMVV